MPVSFDRIPANIRVPLFYAEISSREAAYFQLLQPALLIGPMLPSGTATPLEPVLVIDGPQAAGMFGAGSVLADMVSIYRRNDTFGTLWCIGVEDAGGATGASVTDTINGTATAAGSMALYVGGDRYTALVSVGDDGDTIAGKIADAVNAEPFGLVEATSSGPQVTLTAKGGGSLGNALMKVWNWRGIAAGEMFPPGITVSEGTTNNMLVGGAGTVNWTPIIEAMGDDEYDFICTPWTDTAALNALQEAMNDQTGRWAWSRQIYGHVFGAKMGTLQELVDFGRTRNDPHCSILGYARSPSTSWRYAAAYTAQAAVALRNDPARPIQTLALIGVLPPTRGHKFTIGNSQTLLFNGIATAMETVGVVQIQRSITTYRVNVWNQPDPSWLDVQTPFTLAYVIRFMRQRILQKFPRHKLADDGTPLGFGNAVVTPRIIKAELVAAYSELISEAIVENMDAFKAFLVVERDPNDPNRVNVLLPPDLVNQLRIFAMLVEFRLQYSPGALATGLGTVAAAAATVPLAGFPPPTPGPVPQVAPITPFIG